MYNEDLNSILSELASAEEIKPADIPDIDLYMDQVTTFIDNKLAKEKRDKKDKLLTKTMINNYSKAKILTPSKNKRYNKQQMIQLILIYYLKQILSINDIHDLFSSAFELSEQNDDLINDIYSIFLQIKKGSMGNISSMLKENYELVNKAAESIKEEDREAVQKLLTVLMLTVQAQACKRAAEAIIDKHFKQDKK